MIGQEKSDLCSNTGEFLIEVTTWVGLTVIRLIYGLPLVMHDHAMSTAY